MLIIKLINIYICVYVHFIMLRLSKNSTIVRYRVQIVRIADKSWKQYKSWSNRSSVCKTFAYLIERRRNKNEKNSYLRYRPMRMLIRAKKAARFFWKILKLVHVPVIEFLIDSFHNPLLLFSPSSFFSREMNFNLYISLQIYIYLKQTNRITDKI